MEFTRGDTYKFKFQRLDSDNQPIMTKTEKMWFTVKTNYYTEDIKLQKTLDNGIEYTEDGYYHITIEHDDTKDLSYGAYVCDIQVENAGVVQTIYKGNLTLTNEVTFDGGVA